MEPILVISSILLWITVIMSLLISLSVARQLTSLLSMANDQVKPKMLKVGDSAPSMTLQTLDGHLVTKADYEGKDLALVFISPACTPCRQKMPELETLYSTARKAGTELLVVCLTSLDGTRTFADEVSFDAPLFALPEQSSLSREFKVRGTPSYYLISKNWQIKAAGTFGAEWDSLTKQWQALASQKLKVLAS